MPDRIKEKVKHINQLFIEGLYSKTIDSIEDLKQEKNLAMEDQVSCYLIKSSIYIELGEYRSALKLAEKACNICEKLDNKALLVDSYISKAWALLISRDYDLLLQLISKSEEILKEITIKPKSEFEKRNALLMILTSQYHFYKNGDIAKALEYGELSLKITEEYNNKQELALALQINARLYLIIGDFDRALLYLDRCLKVQRSYRKRDDWLTFNNLGVVNGMRGDLNLALEYTKHSLVLAEELGNKNVIAQSLNNLSLIYRQKGELSHAIEALERNLMIWEELGNKLNIMAGLDSLFIVSLDANSLEHAQEYLSRMHKINEQIDDKTCDTVCRINKSLMLKMSPNLLDQKKAKEMLQQIIKEEMINWEFTERALLHLCEILLLELQKYNKEEIMNDINTLINRLLDFAESQKSFRLLAETNLLQGKLALIQMNLGDARKLFTKAERVAEDHGLHLLARIISTEHDKLLEQLEKWEDLRKIKVPVSERLKYVEINKTLQHMMGKQLIKPPKLVEENPILLLIMDIAGITYFKHEFVKDWDFSNLFSSFISAFNTFSSEIFSKTIDRIKIGNNVIFIKPVEPFLTCYVSKGQSYPAIKKLNKFSEKIKSKSEIWEKLNNAAKFSQELDLDNVPLLRTVLKEIFVNI